MSDTKFLIYQYIHNYADSFGEYPTIEAIMDGTGKSKGVVHYHISNLVADGKVKRRERDGRAELVGYRFKLVKDE